MANQAETKDYWSECGQVYFLDGWGWGLTEKGHTIGLSKEKDILKIFETGQLNGDLHPKQKEALNLILDYRKEEGYGSGTGSMERDGDNGTAGRKPKAIRPLKKRKRLPLRPSRTKNKSLSRR